MKLHLSSPASFKDSQDLDFLEIKIQITETKHVLHNCENMLNNVKPDIVIWGIVRIGLGIDQKLLIHAP